MASHAAVDTITVDLAVSTLNTLPVGVVPFSQSAGDWSRLEESPHLTVERDLRLSGRFEPVVAAQYDLLKFSKSQAKFYITGSLVNDEFLPLSEASHTEKLSLLPCTRSADELEST